MQCKALFFALCLPLMVSAQNLVPNGSFEDYVSCPEHLDGMEFVEHWYKSIMEPGVDYYLNPSPDYFHECALNPALGVPDNAIGNHMAHEGVAYSGLIVFHNISPEVREFMGVSLTTPLVQGQTYYCSMRFVRPVGWSMVGLATNNLGMKFSNSEIFSNTEEVIDGLAHLKVEEVVIDSLNWVLLYGEVVPQQSYQYLHIGNFFSDEETQIQIFNETSQQGYYFIDNVRVSTEPLSITSGEEYISLRPLSIFPNPVDNVLNIFTSRMVKNVQMFDVSGKLIEEFPENKKGLFSLNVEHISKGLYIAIVYFENGEMESIKINKN